MRIDGLKLLEGSTFSNATIASGTAFPALPNSGELFYRSDTKALYCHDGTSWGKVLNALTDGPYLPLSGGTISGPLSVSGTTAFTGTVTGITKAMVGLSNVTNTSDANKPVSTAQAAAIAAAANVQSDWTAAVNSPAFVKNRPELHTFSFLSTNQSTATWYKVAVLPQSTLGTYDQLRLVGMLNDNWAAVNNVPVDITFGNRATDQTGFKEATKWIMLGTQPTNVRIMGYLQSWGGVEIYVFMAPSAYSAASFTLQGFGANLSIVNPANVVGITTAPAGTVVFSTETPVANPPTYLKVPAGSTHFPAGISAGDTNVQQSFNMMTGAGQDPTTPTINSIYEQYRVKVIGVPNKAYAGCFSWGTSSIEVPNGVAYKENYRLNLRAFDEGTATWTPNLLFIRGNGDMAVGGTFQSGSGLYVGPGHAATWAPNPSTSTIYSTVAEIAQFGVSGATAPAVAINSYGGTSNWSTAESVIYVSKGPNAARSINAAGTINTGGTDYAEYMYKAVGCADVLAGQVIGINSEGKITDVWSAAVKFAVKSTNPSFVGGDTWHEGIDKPMLSPRVQPSYKTVIDKEAIPAVPANGMEEIGNPGSPEESHEEIVTPGETDNEWAEREAAYNAAMEIFEAELEANRQKVDRIAFCGQVPVNIQGAIPGQHVVPFDDNGSIGIQLINDDDISFAQYKKSIGQVIAVLEDGRAKIIVKM